LLDGIIYCLYTSHPTKFQSYDDIIKIIHKTPRVTWNEKTQLSHALKYISWELNMNINIVAIRHIKCPYHSYRNILYYMFQNTCIKLLRQCDYAPINILFHDKKLYLINDLNIVPKLINTPDKQQITFEHRILTPTMILQILNKTLSVTFPFAINIYTSYTYLRENSKSVASNMIGQYLPDSLDSKNILHVFITPNLYGHQLFIVQLNIKDNSISYPNIYPNRHLTEGHKITFPSINESEKVGTNQECVCEHPQTEKFFPPRKYRSLGKKFKFKCQNHLKKVSYFLFFSSYPIAKILSS